MPRRPSAPRHEQRPRRILVEPVDELGPSRFLVGESVEQPVEMLRRLRPALRRETRRLVEHEGMGVAMDHHVADELLFVLGERVAPRLRPSAPCRLFRGWRHADLLPGLDPVAGRRVLAVDAAAAPSAPSAKPC